MILIALAYLSGLYKGIDKEPIKIPPDTILINTTDTIIEEVFLDEADGDCFDGVFYPTAVASGR